MMMMVTAAMAVSVAVGQTPVLLKDVQTLTFNLGDLSAGRRAPPQPKLTCEYSPNPALNPTSFQCYNKGVNDMGDVQWECKPNNLDPTLRVYKTNVNCEGFNYPNDPYILAGSCILTYSLALSQPQQQQQNQYQNQNQYQQQQQNNNYNNYYQQGAYYPKEQQKYYTNEVPDNKNYYKSYHPQKSHPGMSHLLKTVIFCCLAGFVFLFVTNFLSSRRRRANGGGGNNNHRNNNNNNGGGGGNNGGGNHRPNNNNFNDDHFGHGGGCGYQNRGFGSSFGPSVGPMGMAAAAVGLHVLDRRHEEQNRRRYEQQQQQQFQHQQQQQYYPPPPPQQQQPYVPPRDEQRSFADTSRR